jgi:DUF2924 family protein
MLAPVKTPFAFRRTIRVWQSRTRPRFEEEEDVNGGHGATTNRESRACQVKLGPVAVLIREWRGTTHQVTVLEEGVLFRGEHYRALSGSFSSIFSGNHVGRGLSLLARRSFARTGEVVGAANLLTLHVRMRDSRTIGMAPLPGRRLTTDHEKQRNQRNAGRSLMCSQLN